MPADPAPRPAPQRRRRGVLAAKVLAGVALGVAAGLVIPWAMFLVAASGLKEATGWSVQMGRVSVIPCQGFRVQEVVLRLPGGSRWQIRSLAAHYRWGDLLRGQLGSHWQASRVAVDHPGVWGIPQPPVVEYASARVVVRRQEVVVERVRGRGPQLRFHGAIEWRRDGTMHGWVRGQIAASVVRGIGIQPTRGMWAPWVLHLKGPAAHPTLRMEARGFSGQIRSLEGSL